VPTYQYACTACDHRFEAVQAFSETSLTECPTCSGLLRKIFSSVGIVFKGSGFYRNDSRSDAGDTVAKGETANGTASESSGDKKDSATPTTGTSGSGSSTDGGSASSGSTGSSGSSGKDSTPAAAAAS